MKEYCNIAAYFHYDDEITNTLEGFGEPVDEKNIIISGLIEFAYHKVLGCKATKNVWEKLENIYAGELNVKEAKL